MPLPPMSLLSPSESHAIQSFLTSMDYTDDGVAPEWSYSLPRLVQAVPDDREALAKATKDLMSLDPDRWNRPNQNSHFHQASQHQAHAQQPLPSPTPQQHQQQLAQSQHYSQHRIPPPQLYGSTSYPPAASYDTPHHPRRSESFPFLKLNPPNMGDQHHYQQHPSQFGHFAGPGIQNQPQQHQSMLPPPTQFNAHQNTYSAPTRRTPTSSSTSVSPPPSATSSTYSHYHSSRHSLSPTLPKLPADRHLQHHQINHPPLLTTPVPSSSSNKRPRPSIEPTPPPASTKSTLLSPSQKKANHIQSEKKRRANIRRGYEALCDAVPALREAIREEETILAAEAESNGRKAKKQRTKEKLDDGGGGIGGGGSGGEKIDGRAGPRSENVVLSKSIDYMNDLLSERESLLQRLEKARSLLPEGHSLLQPASQPPLWERQWKGGAGELKTDGDADEGEDDEDDEGESANGQS